MRNEMKSLIGTLMLVAPVVVLLVVGVAGVAHSAGWGPSLLVLGVVAYLIVALTLAGYES